ncbi:MAG: hypothetical protein HC888_07050 [Candidatus Competibacteraceae bacterium]|nr:hypothetical protein [Candidatus Competibacteraceae bacterium]
MKKSLLIAGTMAVLGVAGIGTQLGAQETDTTAAAAAQGATSWVVDRGVVRTVNITLLGSADTVFLDNDQEMLVSSLTITNGTFETFPVQADTGMIVITDGSDDVIWRGAIQNAGVEHFQFPTPLVLTDNDEISFLSNQAGVTGAINLSFVGTIPGAKNGTTRFVVN